MLSFPSVQPLLPSLSCSIFEEVSRCFSGSWQPLLTALLRSTLYMWALSKESIKGMKLWPPRGRNEVGVAVPQLCTLTPLPAAPQPVPSFPCPTPAPPALCSFSAAPSLPAGKQTKAQARKERDSSRSRQRGVFVPKASCSPWPRQP